jgi:hypothetical protein
MTLPAVTPLGIIVGQALEAVATLPALPAQPLREVLMQTAVSSQGAPLAVGEGSIHRALACLDKLILAGGPEPSATALLRDTAREHADAVLHGVNSNSQHQRNRPTLNDPSPDPGSLANQHKRRRSTLYPY